MPDYMQLELRAALHNSISALFSFSRLAVIVLLLLVVFAMGAIIASGFAAPYEPEWTPPGGGYALTGERLVC